jgi:DNA-binding XRE family transcriptional regulator
VNPVVPLVARPGTASEETGNSFAARRSFQGGTHVDETSDPIAACANHVRALREERMMSREELAERAGVSLRTIWSVETGHECRLDTKRSILRALGIPRMRYRTVFPAPATHAPLPSAHANEPATPRA